jgi:hypothetical protein
MVPVILGPNDRYYDQGRAQALAELAARAEAQKNETLSWFKAPDSAPLAPPSYPDS